MGTTADRTGAGTRRTEKKRQERGRQRIDSLLEAAEAVFAEIGFERATTNLIAQRASASPGTLYQFFSDKQAIAETLGRRYAAQLEDICNSSLGPEQAQAPLFTVVDNIVDTFFAFHRKAPAFYNLFVASTVSPDLRQRLYDLLEMAADKVATLCQARAPDAPKTEMALVARVCVSVWEGVMRLCLQAPSEEERLRVVRELKTVIERYIAPVFGAWGTAAGDAA